SGRAEKQAPGRNDALQATFGVHDVEVNDPGGRRVLTQPVEGLADRLAAEELGKVPVHAAGDRFIQLGPDARRHRTTLSGGPLARVQLLFGDVRAAQSANGKGTREAQILCTICTADANVRRTIFGMVSTHAKPTRTHDCNKSDY